MKKYLLFFLMAVILIGTVIHFGCKKSESIVENPLWGARWILDAIQYSDQNIVLIRRPFSLRFNQDGTVDMVVDCNECNGTYVVDDNGSLTFLDHSTCTEVFCGNDSNDDAFHAALDTASRYEIIGRNLRIFFNNGQSRLNFNAEDIARSSK